MIMIIVMHQLVLVTVIVIIGPRRPSPSTWWRSAGTRTATLRYFFDIFVFCLFFFQSFFKCVCMHIYIYIYTYNYMSCFFLFQTLFYMFLFKPNYVLYNSSDGNFARLFLPETPIGELPFHLTFLERHGTTAFTFYHFLSCYTCLF